jgi:hypothetical protein
VQRLYSMFPSGAPGFGLLILRLTVGLSLHLDASGNLARNPNGWVFAGLLTLSILLAAGLVTPLVAALCGVTEIVLLLMSGTGLSLAAVMVPVYSLPLLLLGPGAYSLDSRLFGRRVLILH